MSLPVNREAIGATTTSALRLLTTHMMGQVSIWFLVDQRTGFVPVGSAADRSGCISSKLKTTGSETFAEHGTFADNCISG
ncbi:MAG: hypothetical protein ACI9R3_000203 [Verrucomicrobiales bacterium]|jgi:hypothetical protein